MKLLTILIICAVLIFGCTATPHQVESGFLGDSDIYSMMQHDGEIGGKVWRAEDFNLSDYDNLIIPRVRIVLNPYGEAQNIRSEDLSSLAKEFREKLVASLEDRYPVVHTPSPATLILRLAITHVALDRRILDALSGAALKKDDLMGASIEVEVLDSFTGRRMVAFMDQEKNERYQDRRIFENWAALIRKRLDQSR